MGTGPTCLKCKTEIFYKQLVEFTDEGVRHRDCDLPYDMPDGAYPTNEPPDTSPPE